MFMYERRRKKRRSGRGGQRQGNIVNEIQINLYGYILASKHLYEPDYQMVGLVSLFNGISTLFRLFNGKAVLPEQ